MTTDIYPRVLFNDGEEATLQDLNAISARTLADIYDRIERACIPVTTDGSLSAQNPAYSNAYDATISPYAFALTPSAARPIQGSANNKVKISKGTLLQALAAESGAEAQLVPFTFTGTDEVSIANGDPANPRIDIVQMALSYVEDTPTSVAFQAVVGGVVTATNYNKRRRIQCTLSVKQGTPAASPTYPLPDASNVMICGVLVGTNYAAAAGFKTEDTAGAVAVLHDQRVPVGFLAPVVQPPDFASTLVNWTAFTDRITATGAGADIFVKYPSLDIARLLGVSVLIKDPAALTTRMVKYSIGDNGAGAVLVASTVLNNANVGGSGAAQHANRFSPMNAMTHVPAAGPTVTTNAKGVTAPMWSSGRRVPFDIIANGVFPQAFESLAFLLTGAPNNTAIGPVTFYMAGGL